jgi:hypothetical protein
MYLKLPAASNIFFSYNSKLLPSYYVPLTGILSRFLCLSDHLLCGSSVRQLTVKISQEKLSSGQNDGLMYSNMQIEMSVGPYVGGRSVKIPILSLLSK